MLRSILARGKKAASGPNFECHALSSLYGDTVHPRRPLGQLLIADMVVNVLAASSEDSIMSLSTEEVLPSIKRPLKLDSKQVPVMRCFSTSGRAEADGGFAEEMRIVKSDGFTPVMVENGKYKPGYVATVPGSVLHIALDMDFGPGQHVDGHPIFTELTLLRSYEHMGVANVSCFSGCTCGTTTIDTFTPNMTYSSPHTIALFITGFVHGTDCVIEVRATEISPRSDACLEIGIIVVSWMDRRCSFCPKLSQRSTRSRCFR